MKRIEKSCEKRILNIPEDVDSNTISPSSDAEILKKLKEKFQDSTTSRSLKVMILTFVPKSRSIKKI
jgi:hypothetical protein